MGKVQSLSELPAELIAKASVLRNESYLSWAEVGRNMGVSARRAKAFADEYCRRADEQWRSRWYAPHTLKPYISNLITQLDPQSPEHLLLLVRSSYFDGAPLSDADYKFICSMAGLDEDQAECALKDKSDRSTIAAGLRAVGYLVKPPRIFGVSQP